MKKYGLYAKVEGTESSKYSHTEGLSDPKKRQQCLMEYQDLEELDDMTSRYDSFEELNDEFKEVYESTRDLYAPVIIVDKNNIESDDSYIIEDIVFAKDKQEIARKDNIRDWLLDYLLNNPHDINKFRGLKDIYINLQAKNKDHSIEYLINVTVNIYFKEHKYKRYRQAYFKLKELDYQRVRRSEVHR